MGRTICGTDESPVSNRGPIGTNGMPNTEVRGPIGLQSRRMGEIRVIIPPLNNQAALLANKWFYRKHKKLSGDGKVTTLNICNPAHDNLRYDWINLYKRAGGKVKTMGVTHDCSPPIQAAYALANVEMTGTYINMSVEIKLESYGRILYGSKFSGTGTDDFWEIPFFVELPNIGGLYTIRVQHELTLMENSVRHEALKEMHMELHMCLKEKEYWRGEYDYKPTGTWSVISDIVSGFTHEPYGGDPSVYEAQQKDNDKERYIKQIRALSKFIDKLELLILKAERFGAQNTVVEFTALAGQLQIIRIKVKGEDFPEYHTFLKTTPRKFAMK